MILKKIKIIQIKSSIGSNKKQKSTLKCLGLRKIGHTVYVLDNSAVRGMINKVKYMVKIDDNKIK